MAKTKKTYLEQLGLEPVNKLTKQICQTRVVFLRKKLKAGKLKGKLEAQAKYYVNWYSWMAKNGGHRGAKRGA